MLKLVSYSLSPFVSSLCLRLCLCIDTGLKWTTCTWPLSFLGMDCLSGSLKAMLTPTALFPRGQRERTLGIMGEFTLQESWNVQCRHRKWDNREKQSWSKRVKFSQTSWRIGSWDWDLLKQLMLWAISMLQGQCHRFSTPTKWFVGWNPTDTLAKRPPSSSQKLHK